MRARGLLFRIGSSSQSQECRTIDIRSALLEHLQVLLNTRRGESVTAPDYGVEDFCDLAHAFPLVLERLEKSVKETIEKYEPRLTNVSVRSLPLAEGKLEIHLEITAQAIDPSARQKFHFRSTMSPGGRVTIR